MHAITEVCSQLLLMTLWGGFFTASQKVFYCCRESNLGHQLTKNIFVDICRRFPDKALGILV